MKKILRYNFDYRGDAVLEPKGEWVKYKDYEQHTFSLMLELIRHVGLISLEFTQEEEPCTSTTTVSQTQK